MTTIDGRDVVTGRAVRVTLTDGRIDSVELLATREGLPLISPGLIDLQINGYGGIDLNSESLTVAELVEIDQRLKAVGTAAWVPTVITGSREKVATILGVLRDAVAAHRELGMLPFVHLEGPYLSPEDGPRGAHDLVQIRDIDLVEIVRWHRIFPIGYLTLSPHWPGTPEKIAAIRRLGIRVAIGHTHADAAQVAGASVAGASLSTHLGNGASPMLPRHPNLVWEQIQDVSLDAGIIADGHHLPAAVVETIVRAKGRDHVYLVSDSVTLAGSTPGSYMTPIGGRVVLEPSGRLHLAGDPRLLAGSAVCLADCLRFLDRETTISRSDAFYLATVTPGRIAADILGVPRLGWLEPGSRGVVVEWSDGLEVTRTWG